MRHVALLGTTGSIGTSTLDVVAAHPDRLKVAALAAGRNRELFRAQCERFRPACVSLGRAEDAAWLARELTYRPAILHGMEGLMACALEGGCDTVVAAVVGAAGLASAELRPCAWASGSAWPTRKAWWWAAPSCARPWPSGSGELLPVDSEHCRPAPAPGRPPSRGRAGGAHHRQRRPVPGVGPGAHPGRHRGPGPQPPHLEDGPQDHHRLRHPHEQGPGSDRGRRCSSAWPRTRSGSPSTPRARCTPWPGSRTAPTSCRCAPTT